jgi:type VI protein secretion system component VasF
MTQDKLTIKTLLALFCSDIDIKLLCEKDQVTTKNLTYTPRQIRNRLNKSIGLICSVLEQNGYDLDEVLKAKYIFSNTLN